MKRGFSLVELSIVLVILGLLVGGILAGKSLIRASELRSVGTEYSKYRTALYAFKDRYFYLPGDMPNAVRVWGAQDGGSNDGMDTVCRAVATAPSPPTLTCNGDGNGWITTNVNGNYAYESYRAWQHLQNAGLIEGGLTGVGPGGGTSYGIPKVGINVPASRLGGAGYFFRYYGLQTAASTSYFPANYGTALWFGLPASSTMGTPALRPEEAWNIDTKTDDGLPGLGRLRALENQPTCHTDTDPVASRYAVDNPELACSFLLITGY